MALVCRKLICVCLLILFSASSWAADKPKTPEQAKQQIQILQKDLQKLNGWLKGLKSKRSDVANQLEDKEKAIQNLLKKIQNLQKNIQKGDQKLGRLRKKQRTLQFSIQQQNKQIAAQLRAVYRSGNKESIKLLLNGSNTEDAQRLVQYNLYFSNARQSMINGFMSEVNDLDLVEKNIRAQRAHQARDAAVFIEQRKNLKNKQVERRHLLAKLNKDLTKGDRRAKQLAQDQNNLREMLKRLEKALADVDMPDQSVPFSTLKGKLVWPLARLSTFTSHGKVKLGGVTLRAKEGEPVHAIFSGRVVFSDWLRGFGFLLIIDHGEGYMSLYGYNQSLLKGVGEWVRANDIVATAGSTGGRSESGLFFAIRHNGKPLNPLSWVKSK